MTTAQRFHLGPIELGTNLRALQEGQPPAANAGQHGWTGNSQGWKNIWPYVNRGTTDSPQGSPGTGSTGRGWRLPVGEVGGTPTGKRYVRAGTWTIALNVSVNRTGLTGSATFNTHVNLYRVTAAGSVGALLASNTGAAMSTNGTTSTRNHNIALPEIVFEPGETIQVEVWVSGESSAGGLAGIGSYSSTHTLNAGASTSVLVTAPGIRTKFTRDPDEEYPTEVLATERLLYFPRLLEELIATVDQDERALILSRVLDEEELTTDDLMRRQAVVRRVASEAHLTVESFERALVVSRELLEEAPTTHEVTRSYATRRDLEEVVLTTDDVSRRQVVYRRTSGEATFGEDVLEERELVLGRVLAEDLDTQPTTQISFTGHRMLSEQHEAEAALARALVLARALDAEQVDGADVLEERELSLGRLLGEGHPTVDALGRRLLLERVLAEAVAVDDGLSRLLDVRREMLEQVEALSILDRTVTFNRDADEALTVGDLLGVEIKINRGLGEHYPTAVAVDRVVNVRRFPFVDLAEAPPDAVTTSPDLVLVDGNPALKLSDPDIYTGL